MKVEEVFMVIIGILSLIIFYKIYKGSLIEGAEVTCAKQWGQCGGEGWTGTTSCCKPYICKKESKWYSQCISSSAPPGPPPPPPTPKECNKKDSDKCKDYCISKMTDDNYPPEEVCENFINTQCFTDELSGDQLEYCFNHFCIMQETKNYDKNCTKIMKFITNQCSGDLDDLDANQRAECISYCKNYPFLCKKDDTPPPTGKCTDPLSEECLDYCIEKGFKNKDKSCDVLKKGFEDNCTADPTGGACEDYCLGLGFENKDPLCNQLE